MYTKQTNEQWLPILGYEGLYEVSDLGRVRGLHRRVADIRGCTQTKRGTVLRPGLTSGYHRVKLCAIDGTPKMHLVHRLVASTFLVNEANYPQVNHIDGCKTNNNVRNLEWCSHSHNVQHAFASGLVPIGSLHHKAKLTEEDIPDIRHRLANRETERSIAKLYGVTKTAISNIRHGKAWAHVP